METFYHFLYVGFFLMLGLSIQFAMLLSEVNVKRKMTPIQFFKERPYKSYLMFAGAIAGYYLTVTSNETPSPPMIIACGVASNHVIDKFCTITQHMKFKNGGS